MIEKSPCIGCEKPIRHIGCHSECERFKTYDAELKKEKAMIRECKNRESLLYSYKVSSIKRSKHKKG